MDPRQKPKQKQTKKQKLQEIGNVLDIELPSGNMPVFLKIIALLTSAGGLSIFSNIFSDFFRPLDITFSAFILRIITGIAMMAVGYGILKKQEWSIWIYGFLGFLSIFINPAIAILPVSVTAYLFYERKYFKYGRMDAIIKKLLQIVHRKVSVKVKALKKSHEDNK